MQNPSVSMFDTDHFIMDSTVTIAITYTDNLSKKIKSFPEFPWSKVKEGLERGKGIRSYPLLLRALETIYAFEGFIDEDRLKCYIPTKIPYPMAIVYGGLAVVVSPRLTDYGLKMQNRLYPPKEGRGNLGSPKEPKKPESTDRKEGE